MELSWTHDRREGVDLVGCRLVNDAGVHRRVSLENRLDGPVLPPRRRGVLESGWNAGGVTVRLAPRTSRALGYACVVRDPETEAVEPPVEVVSVERVDGRAGRTAGSMPGTEPNAGKESANANPSSTDAVRQLGDHRPPRAVVDGMCGTGFIADPSRQPNADPSTEQRADPSTEQRVDPSTGQRADPSTERETDPPAGRRNDPSTERRGDPPTERPARGTGGGPVVTASPADPASVDAWLDAVERRIERAERLDGADVETATEVLAAAGGLTVVSNLEERLDRDADRLRTVATRADDLAERADSAAVPVGALSRLS